MRFLFFIIFSFCCGLSAFCQQLFDRGEKEKTKQTTTQPTENQAAEKPAKPIIEKINAHCLRIGKLTLNQQKKEISFTAETASPDTIIEFILCNHFGKIHETLFITEINPLHLNIALKLLNYKPSKELFPIIKNQQRTNRYHQENVATKAAARFDLFVTHQKKTHHVNDWIYNAKTRKTAEKMPLIYSGSYLTEGRFEASLTGDIIAILTSQGAVANFSNPGREDDTIWFPNPKKYPKEPTKITLTLKKHNAK